MDDDASTGTSTGTGGGDRPGAARRRPSALALLTAGALGAAALGVGGVAWAQTSEPTPPDAGVEQECEKGAGDRGPGRSGSAERTDPAATDV